MHSWPWYAAVPTTCTQAKAHPTAPPGAYEEAYKWSSAYDLYWKDKHTHIDVYGYYPFGSPESIEAYPFTVERDQSTTTDSKGMGGYEASDFLWGKVATLRPPRA